MLTNSQSQSTQGISFPAFVEHQNSVQIFEDMRAKQAKRLRGKKLQQQHQSRRKLSKNFY